MIGREQVGHLVRVISLSISSVRCCCSCNEQTSVREHCSVRVTLRHNAISVIVATFLLRQLRRLPPNFPFFVCFCRYENIGEFEIRTELLYKQDCFQSRDS